MTSLGMPTKKKSVFKTGTENKPKIVWSWVIVRVFMIATSLAAIKAPSRMRLSAVIPTKQKAKKPIQLPILLPSYLA